MRKKLIAGLALLVLFFFGVSTFVESSAWARAGSGGSSGSRGSRSFSAPSMPSSPSPSSPGLSTPGRNPSLGTPGQPSGGFFGRSPFMQGLAGGLAGGMLGSLLFGGIGHASPGGMTGGGIGLLEIAIICLLLFFAYRLFKRRRTRQTVASGTYGHAVYQDEASYSGSPTFYKESQHGAYPAFSEVEQGFRQMKQSAPSFSEEALKETFQEPPEPLFERGGNEFPDLLLDIYFGFLYSFLRSRCRRLHWGVPPFLIFAFFRKGTPRISLRQSGLHDRTRRDRHSDRIRYKVFDFTDTLLTI